MIHPSSSAIRRRPQPTPTFAGLRRYDRKPASVKVHMTDAEGRAFALESVNISQGGLLANGPRGYVMGDRHTLRITTRSREIVLVTARIVRVERVPGQPHRAAIAYAFEQMSRETWSRIGALIAHA